MLFKPNKGATVLLKLGSASVGQLVIADSISMWWFKAAGLTDRHTRQALSLSLSKLRVTAFNPTTTCLLFSLLNSTVSVTASLLLFVVTFSWDGLFFLSVAESLLSAFDFALGSRMLARSLMEKSDNC